MNPRSAIYTDLNMNFPISENIKKHEREKYNLSREWNYIFVACLFSGRALFVKI